MKEFNIPYFYKSSFISAIKDIRKNKDPRKKDISPSILDFGPVIFYMARHFGFCYGVENAIDISYKAILENPDKRIFLLSQMIHNQEVNNDLQSRGVRFLMDTKGHELISWDEITSDDVVIIPAFGTTLKIEEKLKTIGLETIKYNTTCPFVERVWKKSEKLGHENFSVIIHGKYNHEETRATFSRSELNAPSIIIKDIKEASLLGSFILGELPIETFETHFRNRCSSNFNPLKDLERVGVINQTTMLASETQSISEYFKEIMVKKYGKENIEKHFADTRDTLCYATNENQEATYGLLELDADIAFIVGGYNSSNTSHIYELCEKKLPSYFISSADELISDKEIRHFAFKENKRISTKNFLPDKEPLKVILTSGASCPETLVEGVLVKILSFYKNTKTFEEVLEQLEKQF